MTDHIPHLHLQAGDEAFVRVTVLEACSDAFKVRIEDYPGLVITTYAPVSEIAKAQDIFLLKPVRRGDLRFLDPAYSGVNAEKLPK